MKNSAIIIICCSLVISSCNTNQSAQTLQGDSLQHQTKQNDSAGQAMKQDLLKAGDMVKAESPDALTEYEHGYALPRKNEGAAQSPVDIIASGLITHTIRRTDV